MRRRQTQSLPSAYAAATTVMRALVGGSLFHIFKAAFLWIIGIMCDDDDDDNDSDSTLFSLGSDDAAAGKYNLFMLSRPLTHSLSLSVFALYLCVFVCVCVQPHPASLPCLLPSAPKHEICYAPI